MRITTATIMFVFIAMALTLPFALSTCDGGVFCFAATNTSHVPANTCNAHDAAHISLVAQFSECVPQQSIAVVALTILAIISLGVLWTILREFARSFLGLHTTHIDALNAPGDLVHMKPFDALRFAFVRGIIQQQISTHNIA